MSNEISGFFISFTDAEMADLRRRLDLFGYSVDGEGLKQCVIDSLCDREEEGEEEEFVSPTDRLIKTATQYIEDNPEKIVLGLNALKGLSNMLRRKKG